jgi:ATP-binding cassette subfamily B protein
VSRRFLAPEVVQTSAMDCGPAALKSMLEGFGIPISYGRLREACQTDVDGTSINTLEDVAGLLGLEVEQAMLPADLLFLPDASTLPAIIVIRQPGGGTHFVVIWRRVGPLLQLMDPATGRRWISVETFLSTVFIHEQEMAAADWRGWAASSASQSTMEARLSQLGISTSEARALIGAAVADEGWRPLAALDAAVRLTATLVSSRCVGRGEEAQAMVRGLAAKPELLPAHAWPVRAAENAENILMRGAVFLRGLARKEAAPELSLSTELSAALSERPAQPLRELWSLLKQEGWLTPAALAAAMFTASVGLMLEALLFRGLFDLGRNLQLAGQRAAALAAIFLLSLVLLMLEAPISGGVLRLGRRLETRLRLAFLHKIPLLADRYFQSRPKSDMATRSHVIHRIRHLPELAGRMFRAVCELSLTTAGIIWLDPGAAVPAVAAFTASLLLPWIALPALNEQDLRLRTHSGALSRFYLDSLLGIVAIRSHGAGGAIRGAHRSLLGEWAGTALRMQRTVAAIEGAQLLAGFGLVAWLLFDHFARLGDAGSTLLLVYWALSLPAIGQDLALAVWQYPEYRNMTLRVIEPLGAVDAVPAAAVETPIETPAAGMSIEMEQVSVRAGGHTILDHFDFRVTPGSHVAIVGPSGAGKSSFVGLLLGWHRPSSGVLRVDDVEIHPGMIERFRPQIAWVDPEVHLWNRTLLENLTYGSLDGSQPAEAIAAAELREVMERLPEGLQTMLGEGGARVSGGEGQRVRLARAMQRRDARLVILDEPFRGLDRDRRILLMSRVREIWKRATLLCITHDMAQTRGFDRVLVIERGSVVEDGAPADLEAHAGSRYGALLQAEEDIRRGLWAGAEWRRVRMEQGRLVEGGLVERGVET